MNNFKKNHKKSEKILVYQIYKINLETKSYLLQTTRARGAAVKILVILNKFFWGTRYVDGSNKFWQ